MAYTVRSVTPSSFASAGAPSQSLPVDLVTGR